MPLKEDALSATPAEKEEIEDKVRRREYKARNPRPVVGECLKKERRRNRDERHRGLTDKRPRRRVNSRMSSFKT